MAKKTKEHISEESPLKADIQTSEPESSEPLSGEVVSESEVAEIIDAAVDPAVLPLEDNQASTTVDLIDSEVETPELAVLNKASRIRDVVPYDAYSAYLREISQYPRLSREEEQELTLHYHKTKDLQAAYKLVVNNLWLVVKIARDYERAARNILDLIQEGNMGLMEAVKNFDPYRGVRLPSYAVWWIKAYIIRYVIANWRMVKIGTTQAQRKLFFNLKKERDRLEREGFTPGLKLLAEKLQVKESDVVEMEQRLSSADMSVDAPIEPGSDQNMLSVLPSSIESAEDQLAKAEVSRMVSQGLDEFSSTLKPKELIIFRERMLGEDKATLQEISDKLSISRERVRQIENRLREKLKEFFLKKMGSPLSPLDT